MKSNTALKSKRPAKDLSGQRFGYLVAQDYVRLNPTSRRNGWRCKCDCGVVKTVRADSLISGDAKSCGCYSKQAKRRHSHEKSETSEYTIWRMMRRRCNDPNSETYGSYGGRGIKVCKDWEQSFASFYRDMGERPSRIHTLDRIDVNGDYEPENCRWATRRQQVNNRRNNHVAVINGRRLTLSEACELYGNVPYNTAWYRVAKKGMTVGEAIRR